MRGSLTTPQERRRRTEQLIRSYKLPEPCAEALRIIDSLVEMGRLSDLEESRLRAGIWPMVRDPTAAWGSIDCVPLLRLDDAAEPIPASEQKAR